MTGRLRRVRPVGAARRVAAGALLAVLVSVLPGCVGATRPAAKVSVAATGPPGSGASVLPFGRTVPGHRNSVYLALGDSVPFGYTPPAVTPPLTYLDAANFTGYPQHVATALGLSLTNAACPGETTASLISTTAQSSGCENSVGSPVGYRTAFPLHVAYDGAQLAFAVHYLQDHPATGLVTLQIGANDAYVCQTTTSDKCTGTDFTDLLRRVSANLATIYTALRVTAGYRGPIVLVSYYALDYLDPTQVAATQALNGALVAPTERAGGIVADAYGLFKQASAAFRGNPCTAGLQVPLPAGGCDIHPSVSGQLVLAAAVERAVAGAHALR